MHTPLATECVYNVSLLFRPARSLVLLCQTSTITVSSRVLYIIINNNNYNNIHNYTRLILSISRGRLFELFKLNNVMRNMIL